MISEEIEHWLEVPILRESARRVSGGRINECILVDRRDGGSTFLKQNAESALDLFEAEEKSLRLLAASGAIQVPAPQKVGISNHAACLAMEGLTLCQSGSAESHRELGAKLARLHLVESPTGQFGADFDNFIGATPQPNPWTDTWADFFTRERLGHQLQLARANGRIYRNADHLLSFVHEHLAGLTIRPSLIHGDLWSGNVGFLADGEPVLFDPAVYFGDRETDLAFTKMFGGFRPEFYEAYRAIHPAPESIRETIYNLYHVLNHHNLFGGGYDERAETMIAELVE